jgi:hypothetical protein
MVTGIRYTSDNVPTGGRIGYVLRTNVSGIVIGEDYAINTGAAGRVMVRSIFPSPLRVNALLCIDFAGAAPFNSRMWIHGFLVEDR